VEMTPAKFERLTGTSWSAFQAQLAERRRQYRAEHPEIVKSHVLFAGAIRTLSPERTRRFLRRWVRGGGDEASGSCG
jgi:hypothetical protein